MDADLRATLAAVEDRHWWFEGRRRILDAVLSGLGLPERARLLEAGCGNGANLAMLARHGQVTAFEPDDADRAVAAARGVGTVLRGALSDDLPGGPFDAALALDVIEHLDDDRAALAALAGCLRPGGHLVVTVPAHAWLWSRHDERNGHRRRYARAGLARVLREGGLTPERITPFNARLFVPVAFVRVAGRLVGMDGAGTGLPPDRLNRLLTDVFAGEARVLARRDQRIGVSLLAVARRG